MRILSVGRTESLWDRLPPGGTLENPPSAKRPGDTATINLIEGVRTRARCVPIRAAGSPVFILPTARRASQFRRDANRDVGFTSFILLATRPGPIDNRPQVNNLPHKRNAGVTLIELLVVVAIIAIMVGISFPALSSGVDSLRLNQAANGVATFFGSAMNRCTRRQLVMEVAISKAENTLVMRSSEPGFERRMEMPDGITIVDVVPAMVDDSSQSSRSFFMYPGGTVPQFGVRLSNRRHAELIVSVDPMTGVPHIEKP